MAKQRNGPFPHGRLVNMVGWKFGRLTVVQKQGNLPAGHPIWECRCECGNTHYVTSGNLRNGRTLSCGCLYRETRGQSTTTHNKSKHPLYATWRSMFRRCYNIKHEFYRLYGGRGVGVAEEWHGASGFHQFIEDMGARPEKHVLRLIDPLADFSPGNCEWAPVSVIARRRSNARLVTWKNETHTVAEWGRITGIPSKTLMNRLRKWGDDLDRIFTSPVRNFRKRTGKRENQNQGEK